MSVTIEEDDSGTKRAALLAMQKTASDFKRGQAIEEELNRVWDQIKMDAEIMCPKDTGALASTIRVVKIPMGQMTGAWSRIKDITMFDRSIIAGDFSVMNPKSHRPVDYASWVHDGHRFRDGRIMQGVPFLTEALAKNDEELNKAVERALQRLGKQYQSGGQ